MGDIPLIIVRTNQKMNRTDTNAPNPKPRSKPIWNSKPTNLLSC